MLLKIVNHLITNYAIPTIILGIIYLYKFKWDHISNSLSIKDDSGNRISLSHVLFEDKECRQTN